MYMNRLQGSFLSTDDMGNPCGHKWDPHIEEEKKIMLAKGTMITRSEISLRIINRLELHGNGDQ